MTLEVELDSPDGAVRQAIMTAAHYMTHGSDALDQEFGSGYAKAHPELLAAFMRTCAADFHTAVMKAGLQDIRDAIRDRGDGS